MNPLIFRVQQRDLTNWGDYGSILQHGMTQYLDRRDGQFQLLRTGPFAPPITFPACDILVDDKTKVAIENSKKPHFRSVQFRPVRKSKIVGSDWPDWDIAAAKPKHYPNGGEPENYLLAKDHDAALARSMPDFWEVLFSPGAREDRREYEADPENGEIHLFDGSWNGSIWFRGDTTLHTYVDDAARKWIDQRFGEWVRFEPMAFTTPPL